jgi:hypothetical protein
MCDLHATTGSSGPLRGIVYVSRFFPLISTP